MTDIIRQLPDRLANQIAAGEVIQRPASVVKELLENAVDAGAGEISLVIRDAGKELIQVIDNGKGMSTIDARMCFERHATSKIKDINDLFTLTTMGFRGEALASIGAVAQVELITAQPEAPAGTKVVMEGGNFMQQSAAGSIPGTNIAVKNIFFNVPARRKFLKSNNSEFRHILDEFTRVAMAYPHIAFKLINNGSEQYHLRAGSPKNRILDLLGNRFDKYLVSLEEETDYFKLSGFIGKPEIAARTKGNQYFFINNRFIRSPYLHHALSIAYESLIPKEEHPFYVLFFEIDPAKVDVNVHPTKQEVKFEDERTMYSFLKSIVTNVLARFNIAPSLDFTLTPEIQQLESIHTPDSKINFDAVSKGFLSQAFSKANNAHFIEKSTQRKEWEAARNHFFDQDFAQTGSVSSRHSQASPEFIRFPEEDQEQDSDKQIIYWKEYLITAGKSGIMFVHIQRAQERIMYDQLLEMYLYERSASQKLLFPEMLELSPEEYAVIEEMTPGLQKIGFEISSMGKNTVAVHSVPPELVQADVRGTLEEIIEQSKYSDEHKVVQDIERVLRITSRRISNKYQPSQEAHLALLGRLFACAQPEYSPRGEKIIFTLHSAEILAQFK